MPVSRPSPEDLTRIAADYHFSIPPERMAAVAALVEGFLAPYDDLDASDEPHRRCAIHGRRPSARPRRTTRWAPGTCGPGSTVPPGGPLSGRTVAVKDNIARCRRPDDERALPLEGYVPEADATVVDRLLDAGATIAGQVGLRETCASPAAATPPTPGRCATRTTAPGPRAGRRAARRRWSRPARSTWPSAATRAARSASRAAGAASRAKPTWGWCPTPARSRSRRRWTTSARSPAPRGMSRCCCRSSPGRTGWTPASTAGLPPQRLPRPRSTGDVAGLRIGVRARGLRASRACREPDVDEAVRRAAQRLREAGRRGRGGRPSRGTGTRWRCGTRSRWRARPGSWWPARASATGWKGRYSTS